MARSRVMRRKPGSCACGARLRRDSRIIPPRMSLLHYTPSGAGDASAGQEYPLRHSAEGDHTAGDNFAATAQPVLALSVWAAATAAPSAVLYLGLVAFHTSRSSDSAQTNRTSAPPHYGQAPARVSVAIARYTGWRQ